MSENSKKVSVTIQTYSLVRKGVTPPTKELTLTLTADTIEEVHAKIVKLYVSAETTKENKDEQEKPV